MVAHDEERMIGDAIASILAQTFGDFELIVVDDGSSDRTVEIVKGFRDPRIRVISQPNAGQPAGMNRGIAASTGELIARHDADDLSLLERFGRQAAFLDAHPGVALVGTGAVLRDAQGRERLFRVQTSDRAIRLAMAWENPFVHTAVMMRRSAVTAAGGYADMLFEDYDLWIRMAAAGALANLPEPLVVRRVREGSRGRSGRRSLALRQKLRLQRQAIQRLRLPAAARLGLLRTLAGVAVYATLEWMRGLPSSGTSRAA